MGTFHEMTANHEITKLLQEISAGDESSPERLLELVYDDLRRLAASYMQNERRDHTLQATAVVHEAYMRLVDWKNVTWQNRAQFFAVAAKVMRKVLIDHARARATSKRRGGDKLLLDDAVSLPDHRQLDLLAVDEILNSLEKLDPRQAKIVELRFFGGLTIEETAHVMDLGESTIRREWTFAKAWLQRELGRREA